MGRRGADGFAFEGEYTGADSGGQATRIEKPAAGDGLTGMGRVAESSEEVEMHGTVKNCVYEQVDRPADKLVVGTKVLCK